jgi:hypothetical protein
MSAIKWVVMTGALFAIPILKPALADPTIDHHLPPGTAADHSAIHERHMQEMSSVTSPRDRDSQVPGKLPASPGQDAFGAVQEIVRLLEADPGTDWTRVSLDTLREHLIDMNRVTLEARADAVPVENGLRIDITGSGRTLDAIRRMVPAHATELNRLPHWNARAETLESGVRLTVTSPDPAEAAKIRGLGFIGLMASGGHHQVHHLAMAKGEPIH